MIFALAARLKVVESLKVTPSVELACVCRMSPWKMSSCSLSGVELLLRVTVALPVRVATLPIGSSAAAGAGEGAAAGAGVRSSQCRCALSGVWTHWRAATGRMSGGLQRRA